MTERTILHYLEDILKALESIQDYVENMEFDSFKVDKKTIRATEREFEIIGESVKKLPDTLTSRYPDTPWRAIAGMRPPYPSLLGYRQGNNLEDNTRVYS